MDSFRTNRSSLVACLLALSVVAISARAQSLAVRASAAYDETVAPGAAATAFGSGFTAESAVAAVGRDLRLPRTLAGVSVLVDGRAAELAYVSPGQINFIVPAQTALGVVDVTVSEGGRVVASGAMTVARLAPALYSSDSSGAGSGLILNAATYARGPFPSQTAELPGCDKQSRLTLFASGIRFAGNPQRLPLSTDSGQVAVVLEDSLGVAYPAEVESAAASEDYPGVDEVRFVAPEGVEGELSVRVWAEGVASNPVTLSLYRTEEPTRDCSDFGVVYVYNTVADLLAGDLWDVVRPETVFADLAEVPGDWPISGVGTTALEFRNGEVVATGFAGAPVLNWADPHFPPTVRILTEEPIPFVGAAAGNPASVIVRQAEPGRPIHPQILELAQESGLAFASIRVSGRFVPVHYSVAHNLLKQGTPLTDPSVDKAPFQLFFATDAPAEWELSGFYASAASVQEVVSVRGAPVHLHGLQIDQSRAGHIDNALVENAEIRLYPLAAPVVHDADLTVSDVAIADGQITFSILNSGNGDVSRTTVQGRVDDQVVFQVELSDLLRGEARVIALQLSAGVSAPGLTIVVDPFNDVLESDEFNNAYFVGESSIP